MPGQLRPHMRSSVWNADASVDAASALTCASPLCLQLQSIVEGRFKPLLDALSSPAITSAAAAAASAKKPKPDAGSKVKGRRKAEKAAAAAALMEAGQHLPSVEGTAGGAGGDAEEEEVAAEEGLLPEDDGVVGRRMPPPSYLSTLIGQMALQGGPAEGAAAAQVCEEEGEGCIALG